jgi:hypothetical protein
MSSNIDEPIIITFSPGDFVELTSGVYQGKRGYITKCINGTADIHGLYSVVVDNSNPISLPGPDTRSSSLDLLSLFMDNIHNPKLCQGKTRNVSL